MGIVSTCVSSSDLDSWMGKDMAVLSALGKLTSPTFPTSSAHPPVSVTSSGSAPLGVHGKPAAP